jgi:hypothetical protein
MHKNTILTLSFLTYWKNCSSQSYKFIEYHVGNTRYKCKASSNSLVVRRNVGDLRFGNKTFEAVQSFQYLGNIIGNTNNNNKCIKERIMMGNKAYYANRQLVNSSLISRNSKLQIYRTLVCLVVTYGSESWTLTMEEERALAVSERKILWKIYGPVKENELWRIR